MREQEIPRFPIDPNLFEASQTVHIETRREEHRHVRRTLAELLEGNCRFQQAMAIVGGEVREYART
jgi:hypothetical protein